jgi:pilus assembly protein CpaE
MASPSISQQADSGAKTTERASLLAFITDAESENALQDGLGELVPSIQLRRASVRQATALLRKMPSPEVLIVDISGEDAPLAALHDLSEVVEPSTRVLVVGDRADMNFYRSLTRDLGVAEYLYKPLAKEMVARMFGPACAARPITSGALQGGRIVAVTGACGGVGTTTIAANLSFYLGEELKRHTILFDPDIYTGSAAMMLGGRAGTGLRLALETPSRIDELFVERSAQPVSERLSVLAGDEKVTEIAEVAEGAGRALLTALRRRYNFVVADVPSAPIPLYRELLMLAHQRVLVLDPTLSSMRNALRLLALPTGPEQVRRAVLVLNRVGQPGGLTRAQIEEALEMNIDIVIPYQPRLVGNSATLGTPAAASSGGFRNGILHLAREVAFVSEGGPPIKIPVPTSSGPFGLGKLRDMLGRREV